MFGSDFNDKQLQFLTLLFNDEEVFIPHMTKEKVMYLFACKHQKPFMVKDVRKMCSIMDALCKQNYISPTWQAIADKNRCFVSVRGNHISRNMLSSAKYRSLNDSVCGDYGRYDNWISRLETFK